MSAVTRLDLALFERGLCESREKAKALVMAGEVFLNSRKETKPGTRVKDEDKLEVRAKSCAYVSRGGLKLEKAVKAFSLDLKNRVCMDVGASTGGFTDCMLQNGAEKVYAVDVGYGQLAWKLRTDQRVISLERVNFRYITKEQVPEPVDFASVDVSFISLRLILPVLFGMLSQDGQAVCLIKPQFEAGREKVGKKGVVRDKEVHEEVINASIGYAKQSGFHLLGLDYSPIKGPCGNIEYLMHISKKSAHDRALPAAGEVVGLSHSELGG